VPRADRVPFLPGHSMVAVRTSLNGVGGFALLVDTGAALTMISRQAAARLGIDTTRPLRTQPLAGVGNTSAVPFVRLDRVQVGASLGTGIEASVFDLPPLFRVDGVIGLNFLRRFRVTVEFDTRTLVLREPPVRRP
jgi:clan AA aspartic protease (TIGR02281 family)